MDAARLDADRQQPTAGRLAGGTASACVAAMAARRGRPVAARRGRPVAALVARCSGVLMPLTQPVSLYLGTGIAVGDLYADNFEPDSVPLGAVVFGGVVLGIASTLGGVRRAGRPA